MKKPLLMTAFIVGGLASTAGWVYLNDAEENVIERQDVYSSFPKTVDQQNTTIADPGEKPTDLIESKTLSSEEIKKYGNYQNLFELKKKYQAFFAAADEMDESVKETKIDEMIAEIQQLEIEKRISGAESMMMMLALLKQIPESEETKQLGKDIMARYQAYSDARMKDYLENPDPKFTKYKTREAEIVKEVMQMQSYPDGLSRDKYLAQRLQEARSEIYVLTQGN